MALQSTRTYLRSRIRAFAAGLRNAARCIAACALAFVPVGARAFDGEVAWWSTAHPQGPIVAPLASALAPDGRLLIAALANTADAGCSNRRSTVLARLLPDGRPDPSFGDSTTPGRTVLLGLCDESLALRAIAIRADGRLVLAGVRQATGGRNLAIVIRLLPNGALDTAFGSGGTAYFPRNSAEVAHDEADAVAVESGGARRTFVGSRLGLVGQNRVGAVFALDDDGTLLPWGATVDALGRRYQAETFARAFSSCVATLIGVHLGVDPTTLLSVAEVGCAQTAGQQPTSITPVVLRTPLAGNGASVRRPFTYAATSALDAQGYVPDGHVFTFSRSIASGPRLWLVASRYVDGQPGLAPTVLAAVGTDGNLDATQFSGSGRAVIETPPSIGFRPFGIAMQSGGRIAVIGSAVQGVTTIAAIRVLGASGAVDTTYGADGSGLNVVGGPFPGAYAFNIHTRAGSDDIVGSAYRSTGGTPPSGALLGFSLADRGVQVFRAGFETPP